MDQLTKRQAELLRLIRVFVREKGYPPTVRELVALTGRRSTAGVQKLLDALRKKGYIKRVRGRSRGIVPVQGGSTVWIPLVGWAAAGSLAVSEEHLGGYDTPNGSAVLASEDFFLLRVRGG
jgi:repressor LexA